MAQWTRARSPGRITARETWGEMPGVPLVCVSPRLQQACQRDLGQGGQGLLAIWLFQVVDQVGEGEGQQLPRGKGEGHRPRVQGRSFPGLCIRQPSYKTHISGRLISRSRRSPVGTMQKCQVTMVSTGYGVPAKWPPSQGRHILTVKLPTAPGSSPWEPLPTAARYVSQGVTPGLRDF